MRITISTDPERQLQESYNMGPMAMGVGPPMPQKRAVGREFFWAAERWLGLIGVGLTLYSQFKAIQRGETPPVPPSVMD